MKTLLKHGVEMEHVTPAEMRQMLAERQQSGTRRIRAPQIIALDATGAGQSEVYKCPDGYIFEVRRVVLDIDTATDPSTGNVAVNVAGRAVEYLRSSTRIEYGQPMYNGVVQIPGSQTWGAEQGPLLLNGEWFEVRVRGLTANSHLSVVVEGMLRSPRDD